MPSDPRLSIVIPARNEARRLPRTLDLLRARFCRTPGETEVIVVDDGSTDGTAAAARAAGAEWSDLRVIELPRNLGKGAAVRCGVLAARGDVVAFVDADLPYDPAGFELAAARFAAGADVVIGGRDLPESSVSVGYSLVRRFSGRVYSLLVNRLAVRGIPDTQCGFKLFTRAAARALFPRVTLAGYAFDVELLTLAQRTGARIERIPVRLTHSHDSNIRLLRDSLRMFRDLLIINRRRARGVYEPLPAG